MESIQINDPDYYMSEPHCQIACTLTAQSDYEAMTAALAAAGIDGEGTKVIHGSDGAEIMDKDGEHHGFLANIARIFPTINTHVATNMEAVEDVLHAGGYAIAVPAVTEEDEDSVAAIMLRHHGENLFWWGLHTRLQYGSSNVAQRLPSAFRTCLS